MSEPFLGEIKIFSINYAPKGWAFCNGQILSITQNQALFAILGTTYGGDGIRTFALPNLQGRIPYHTSATFVLGQTGGEEAHLLTTQEIPSHTHTVQASAAAGPDQGSPANNLWVAQTAGAYAPTANNAMSGTAIGFAGSNASHENRPPFLVLNFCIALVGIFPSRG